MRIPYRVTETTLPSALPDMRGQIRIIPASGGSPDSVWVARDNGSGTMEWVKLADQHRQYATFGPFFANDLAATATVDLTAAFFDAATTVLRSTPDIYLPVAGEIVGISAMTDANRTGGTATVKAKINGVTTAFSGGGTCVIDGTNTRRHAIQVRDGAGAAFTAGKRASLEVVTASWGPTTANMSAWLIVRFDV